MSVLNSQVKFPKTRGGRFLVSLCVCYLLVLILFLRNVFGAFVDEGFGHIALNPLFLPFIIAYYAAFAFLCAVGVFIIIEICYQISEKRAQTPSKDSKET